MLELAGIIILGILAQWLAWLIRVPAILPLILTGLLVGPLSTLWTEDGSKLLEPIYNEDLQKGLFPGEYLFYFVSLSIGIILFEGGLTLRRSELTNVGPAILKLIVVGSIITFFGAGLGAHYIMSLNWSIAFLFAALIIVTGPTVIAPILQNVPLNRNIATVLKWEGILIDPLGALVAVLVFEFIQSSGGNFTAYALLTFLEIVLIGVLLGGAAAYLLYWLIKSEWIPSFLLNIFTLAFVLSLFVASDQMVHESGLLSVVIMGMVMGNLNVPRLKDILNFKEAISILLVSILFILLAANIEMEQLELLLQDWRAVGLFALVVFGLRPLSVLLSTNQSDLSLKEKIFISWVGPRGIVAAGIASLFGITLTRDNVPGAEYITPLVFMIVLGTVVINATTARMVAKLLGVIQTSASGILFIGANQAARILAKYLQENKRYVVMVDSNEISINKAREEGIEALAVNIYTEDLHNQLQLLDVGYLVAMTSNSEVNNFAVKRYQKEFGEQGSFRLLTPEELRKDRIVLPKQGIFSYTDDFLNLNEIARDYPEMHEIPIESQEQLANLIQSMAQSAYQAPIFIKEPSGVLQPIPYQLDAVKIADGTALVYMGKKEG